MPILSKSLCFLVQLKLIHRFNFNFQILSVTLQQAIFLGERSTSHPMQCHPCPWGLWRWQSITRVWGSWGMGKAWGSWCLVHETESPGPITVCCSPEDFSPCSKSSWPDSSLVQCLGRFLFLRKEHDGTSLFPLLTIAFINAYISQWVLNYLLKLYTASLTWLWCQHGTCLPREPEEHSELQQGENHLISLLMSNLQQQRGFCRWQPDETVASLSPASLDAALQDSPGPHHVGQSKEDPNIPRLSLQSITQPTYCLKLPGDRGDKPRPSCASSSHHSSWTCRKILFKNSNMFQCSATTKLPLLSQAWSRLQRGLQ